MTTGPLSSSSPASTSGPASSSGPLSTRGPRADLGVIGGSGFYEFLTDAERVPVPTPFGDPSDDLVVGELEGRRIAFIARHGKGHRFQPHEVNYRANLWALRSVGVRQILSPCAVGSLKSELGPGTFVIPDQVVDRTWGRPQTVYAGEGEVVHVGFADPFCPRGRAVVSEAAEAAGKQVAGDGTLVVINGPRFSSKAESQWHQAAGWSIVGMTTMPEAAIARELAMCFTTVAVVTDYDVGVHGGEAVTHEEVLRVFAQNIDGLKSVLRAAIVRMPETEPDAEATCACRRSLDGIRLPFALPG